MRHADFLKSTGLIFALGAILSGCQTAPKPTQTQEATPTSSGSGEEQEAATADASAFPDALEICPGVYVSNAPPAVDDVITEYAVLVQAAPDVLVATAPVSNGCVSSGFGPRNGKLHKGIDYFSRAQAAADILAAAPGVVVEAKYRSDYGNMLVIDHGEGVYTRYAHLASFADGITIGAKVKRGQALGVMGSTAGYEVPRHLHYEVLEGDYDTPKKSFGLEPVNVFTLPAAK